MSQEMATICVIFNKKVQNGGNPHFINKTENIYLIVNCRQANKVLCNHRLHGHTFSVSANKERSVI